MKAKHSLFSDFWTLAALLKSQPLAISVNCLTSYSILPKILLMFSITVK